MTNDHEYKKWKNQKLNQLKLYTKKNVVGEKEKAYCFRHTASYSIEKTFALLLLKELLIHENIPKTRNEGWSIVGNSQ